jgi:hypothetical protein
VLFTVGRAAPRRAQDVARRPLGDRGHLDAGLPTVVTTLVSTTSRPAAAPFMTRIVAGPVLPEAPPPRPPKPEARLGAVWPGWPAPGDIAPGFMIIVFS